MICSILFILKSCNLLVMNLFLLQIRVWTLCRRGPLCTKLTSFHRYEVESTVEKFSVGKMGIYLEIIQKSNFFHDKNLVHVKVASSFSEHCMTVIGNLSFQVSFKQ